jgi:hypothetical protein
MNKNPEVVAEPAQGFKPPGSFLILQTLLYFDRFYVYLLCIITLLINIYKLNALPYPKGYFAIEIIVLAFYFILSQLRIEFGMVGNRIESIKQMFMMIFFTGFAVLCNVYFWAA